MVRIHGAEQMKTTYYNLLIELVKDFKDRINRGGDISEIVVEEKIERRKWSRRSTLTIVISVKLGSREVGVIARASRLWFKTDYYNELKEGLAKELIHNYFVFGLYKPFKEKTKIAE